MNTENFNNNNNSKQQIISSKEPSKEFLKALNHLKPKWNGKYSEGYRGATIIYREFRSLVRLGKKEGLSEDYVLDQLKERKQEPCLECGKEITVIYENGHTFEENQYCKACKNIRDRREYEEEQERTRREEEPIERYSNKILGYRADYDIPYEEYLEIEKERRESIDKQLEPIKEAIEYGRSSNNRTKKIKLPKGMTKTKWLKQQREKRKQAKYEDKQRRIDQHLRFHGSPNRLIIQRIDKIRCDCEAQEMRIGKFCATCQLLIKVDSYMLGLFREAYERRKSRSEDGVK